MRKPALLILGTLASASLVAQSSEPATAQPPTIKWRGSIWASGVTQNKQTADGSVAFRPMESGEDAFSLDGLTLGMDATLGQGWSARVTLMGGRVGELTNQAAGETGSIALPEVQLVWTGKNDKLTFGRMNTYIGMEFMEGTQDATASRGLLCTYAAPFTQVGLVWRHTFSTAWSTDVFLFNGEDRVKDNNRSKTLGLGLNYNHEGATDKYVSLMVYRGAEQDGLGENANTGAEGRKRERVSMLGQWVWGASTLQWEAEYGSEPFLPTTITGATGSENVKATWSGFGLIYKYQLNERWAGFARVETFKDDTGVRLNYDTTVADAYGTTKGADLKATSFCVGMERKWGQVFTRFELRRDDLNRELREGQAGDGKPFKSATSATWSLGASF